MIYLRSTIFVIYMILMTTAISLVFFIPSFFLKREQVFNLVCKNWAILSVKALKFICNVEIDIRGIKNLPKNSNFIIASKHQSTLETMLFNILIKNNTYILKKELLYIPLFGYFLYKSGMIVIDRSKGGISIKKINEKAKIAIDNNQNLVIFPQGTRTKIGEEKKYKAGIYSLYQENIAPIIPVALNTGLIWPKGSFLKHPKICILEFLKPIEKGLSKEIFMQKLEQIIEDKTQELVKEAKLS